MDKEKQIKKAMKGESTFAEAIAGKELSPELINKIQEYYKLATKDRSIISSIDDKDLLDLFQNSINNRYDTLKEICEAIDLDNEKKETSKVINGMKQDMDKIVSSNEETRRELMEKKIVDKANLLPDGEEKEKILAMSQAYTDAYKLTPLVEFIYKDDFKKKYEKAVKRYNRYFTDFDYILEKTSNASVSNLTKIYQLMNRTKDEKNTRIKFENDEPMQYCLTLALYCEDVKYTDKPKVWYMYSSIISMLHIMSSYTLTPFIKEKVDYLNQFYDEIKKVL